MPTLAEALETYLRVKSLKSSTASQYRQFLQRCTPDWLELDISKIDARMCLDRYQDLSAANSAYATSSGKGQAQLTFRILRAVFNFASAYWEITLINPISKVRAVGVWSRLSDRTSFIDADQLAEWFRLLQRLPAVDRDYNLALLLTGGRRCEIGGLEWKEVDFTKKLLILPPHRTKNKKGHVVPMSRQLEMILIERRAYGEKSQYVFSTPESPDAPYSKNRRAYDRIDEALGIACNPHTLRRTFATIARHKCKVDKDIVKLCLNHSPGDITDRYIQTDPEDLRPHFQTVADYVWLKIKGEKPRIRLVAR